MMSKMPLLKAIKCAFLLRVNLKLAPPTPWSLLRFNKNKKVLKRSPPRNFDCDLKLLKKRNERKTFALTIGFGC